MIEAPDFVEPFESWRVWKIVREEGEYSLGSVMHRMVWPAGEALTAECLRRHRLPWFGRRNPHDAPGGFCECGIYAAGLERVGQYVTEGVGRGVARVLGRVALWGTVIECERGFRASRAYPTHIYVPADAGEPWRIGWEEIAVGLWRYNVPIEPLATRAAEATSHLVARQAA